MKNKRIRFDDRFYYTIFDILLMIISLLLILCFDLPIYGYIIMIVLFTICLSGLYTFPRWGIYFNYKLGSIKYLGTHKIKKRIINMDEIKKISFVEIYVPKGKGITPKDSFAYYGTVDEVYRNGKIFKFVIQLRNEDIIEIPYYNLFKSNSKKRVNKQVQRINSILNEFNFYLLNKSII